MSKSYVKSTRALNGTSCPKVKKRLDISKTSETFSFSKEKRATEKRIALESNDSKIDDKLIQLKKRSTFTKSKLITNRPMARSKDKDNCSCKKTKSFQIDLETKYEDLKLHHNIALKKIEHLEETLSHLTSINNAMEVENLKLKKEFKDVSNENKKLYKEYLSEKERNDKECKMYCELLDSEKKENKHLIEQNHKLETELLSKNEKILKNIEELAELKKKNTEFKQSSINNNEKICLSPNRVGNVTKERVEKSLSILDSRKWITDDTIQIYFSLINNKVVKSKVYLMEPSIAQAVKCLEETDEIVQPLKLLEKSYIFVPVNNSEAEPSNEDSKSQKEEGSGSHWSLLFYIKTNHKFYHFDSISNLNNSSAKKIVSKLSSHLGSVPFVNLQTPQQQNSVDCGVYVMLFTDFLIKRIVKRENSNMRTYSPTESEIVAALPEISGNDVLTKRGQLASLIFNSQYSILSGESVFSLMFG